VLDDVSGGTPDDDRMSEDAAPEQGPDREDPRPGGIGQGATVAEAAALEAQRLLEEQKDKYLRLAAEFDNYRKRVAREREEVGKRAQGELVRRILDALDDMGRVTDVDPDGVDSRAIMEGVDAVQKKLLRELGGAGLEVLKPLDQPFNPEVHEAVATERALSPEDDHLIARVYQPGYVFQGQLLRPARVVVKQWADE